jgi:hypothetical protein
MPRNAKRSGRTSVQKRRFGPLQREVSIIGQGTWYIEEGDPTSAIAALRRGIDLETNRYHGDVWRRRLVLPSIRSRTLELRVEAIGRKLRIDEISPLIYARARYPRTAAATKRPPDLYFADLSAMILNL